MIEAGATCLCISAVNLEFDRAESALANHHDIAILAVNRVSGFGFRVPGSRFQVSGFKFQGLKLQD